MRLRPDTRFILHVAFFIAAPLAASINAADAKDASTRPTLDGYAVEQADGRHVHVHVDERLGGWPRPRCYTSGTRTDCYIKPRKK